MSATITYKGETLTTAANQTRTLETAGTYMEDDITITDVSTVPSGTKNISITQNGTTTEDVTNYASASITANVPNSYSASDEGKVVDNGALVSQTSDTVTANDTYDTTLINSLTVNVSGGGGISVDGLAMNTEPSGAVTLLTATAIKANALRAKAQMTSLSSTSVTSVESESLRQCNGLSTVSLPNLTSQIPSYTFTDCKNLETADIGKATTIQSNGFSNCNKLTVLVLRRTSLCALGNVSAFSNTPLQGYSGRSATVYVPQDLLMTYQSASNWSSLSSVTFAKIEGSIYE